jgi:hypothetical protein
VVVSMVELVELVESVKLVVVVAAVAAVVAVVVVVILFLFLLWVLIFDGGCSCELSLGRACGGWSLDLERARRAAAVTVGDTDLLLSSKVGEFGRELALVNRSTLLSFFKGEWTLFLRSREGLIWNTTLSKLEPDIDRRRAERAAASLVDVCTNAEASVAWTNMVLGEALLWIDCLTAGLEGGWR